MNFASKLLTGVKNVIMNKIVFSQIEIDELVDRIASRVVEMQNKNNAESNLLTRSETAELLSISLATLNIWTKDGRVQQYGIGNRIYYKKDEVLNSLKAI